MKNKFYSVVIAFIILCSGMLAIGQDDATSGTIDAINQMGEAQIEGIQNEWGEVTSAHEHISEGLESLNNYLEIGSSAIDLYNAMQALDESECVPDFTTNAEAMMPSGCSDDPECGSCYEQAISRLTTVRRSLARMSCINTNTKNFTESAIAFGDNVAGIHGVIGLAWQAERKGIKDAHNDFKKTYDRKYTDLMNSLQTALQQINTCESRFGIRDWYQKFGFMYFELMKEKYKRID